MLFSLQEKRNRTQQSGRELCRQVLKRKINFFSFSYQSIFYRILSNAQCLYFLLFSDI